MELHAQDMPVKYWRELFWPWLYFLLPIFKTIYHMTMKILSFDLANLGQSYCIICFFRIYIRHIGPFTIFADSLIIKKDCNCVQTPCWTPPPPLVRLTLCAVSKPLGCFGVGLRSSFLHVAMITSTIATWRKEDLKPTPKQPSGLLTAHK